MTTGRDDGSVDQGEPSSAELCVAIRTWRIPGVRPSSFGEARLFFRPKRLANLGLCLQPIAADQVKTIGNRRKDRVEASANRCGLARQVDDQRGAARAGDLTREDRS